MWTVRPSLFSILGRRKIYYCYFSGGYILSIKNVYIISYISDENNIIFITFQESIDSSRERMIAGIIMSPENKLTEVKNKVIRLAKRKQK